jgi:glucosamine-6-phosphate deaminase
VSRVAARVEVVEDYEELSAKAAERTATPRARVVAATGRTPIGAYGELARRHARGELDTSSLVVHQLDEYLGAGSDGSLSLGAWMRRSFLDPLEIPDDRVVWLPTDGGAAVLASYDRAVVDAGGFDLAVLGIGVNGHLGFNEPPSDGSAPTRSVTLSDESRRSNAAYRNDGRPAPERAVTIGLGPLLAARTIVLLASGTAKAGILGRALRGPVTPSVPASFLQEVPDLRVIADRAAWGDGG